MEGNERYEGHRPVTRKERIISIDISNRIFGKYTRRLVYILSHNINTHSLKRIFPPVVNKKILSPLLNDVIHPNDKKLTFKLLAFRTVYVIVYTEIIPRNFKRQFMLKNSTNAGDVTEMYLKLFMPSAHAFFYSKFPKQFFFYFRQRGMRPIRHHQLPWLFLNIYTRVLLVAQKSFVCWRLSRDKRVSARHT